MKKAILLLFISFSAFSQTKEPSTNFYIENQKVYWQYVFEVPNKTSNELLALFQKQVITSLKKDNFQIIDKTVSFTVVDDKINYKKYGGTSMGSIIFLHNFVSYLVIIDFKDNKYRITIKDIYLDSKNYMALDRGEFENYITKKRNTLFTTNNLAVTALTYYDKQFIEQYSLDTIEKTNNDW